MYHGNVLVVGSRQFLRTGTNVPWAHCNTGNIYSKAKPFAVLVVVSLPRLVESLEINLLLLFTIKTDFIIWDHKKCYRYLLNSEVTSAPEQADAICWNGVIRNWGSSSRIIMTVVCFVSYKQNLSRKSSGFANVFNFSGWNIWNLCFWQRQLNPQLSLSVIVNVEFMLPEF